MASLNEINAFVSIVRHGSLTKAAEETEIPKSTLSRHLKDLETRLGVVLIQRTTRRFSLTPAGEKYYQTCARLLEELTELERETTETQKVPRGLVKFTAPMEMGSYFLPALFREFSNKYPEIQLECHFTDRIVDFTAENFDLALRAGRLPDSSLVAKKLGNESAVLVAAPDYVRKHRKIQTPQDLHQQCCIQFLAASELAGWNLVSGQKRENLIIKNSHRSTSLSAILALVKSGLGIGLLPQFLVNEGLMSGELERVLPDWKSPTNSYYLVYSAQRHLPLRVRLLFDFLAEKIPGLLI